MNTKLKALGLGLLAVLAMSAFAVVNASATVSGHFVSDTTHTIVKGTESGTHFLNFKGESGEPIGCTHASYEGTITGETVTTVTVSPVYKECSTGRKAPHEIAVTMNGCDYTFHSAGTNKHGTVSVDCPVGKAIEIHHPNCTMTVPAQTPTATTLTGGATYTTTVEEGKHALTVDITVGNIEVQYHGGICIFTGTTHKFTMEGSVTVWGTDTAGNRVNITHT